MLSVVDTLTTSITVCTSERTPAKLARLFLLMILTALFIGCTDQNTSAPGRKLPQVRPAPDLSSPDRALKSYWAMQDWTRKTDVSDEELARYAVRRKEWLEAMTLVLTGEELSDKQKVPSPTLEEYERDILEVRVETDTRAVALVRIRNVTPVPVGAEMSRISEQQRLNGDQYRYIIEKTAVGWKVSEVWRAPLYAGQGWHKMSGYKVTAPTYTSP